MDERTDVCMDVRMGILTDVTFRPPLMLLCQLRRLNLKIYCWVKEFWKQISIWQRYEQKHSSNFFRLSG